MITDNLPLEVWGMRFFGSWSWEACLFLSNHRLLFSYAGIIFRRWPLLIYSVSPGPGGSVLGRRPYTTCVHWDIFFPTHPPPFHGARTCQAASQNSLNNRSRSPQLFYWQVNPVLKRWRSMSRSSARQQDISKSFPADLTSISVLLSFKNFSLHSPIKGKKFYLLAL